MLNNPPNLTFDKWRLIKIPSYLVEFSQEERIGIIRQIINLDMSETMHNDQDEISDGLHPLMANKQHLASTLVEEWFTEAVPFIVVLREIGGQQ